MRVPGSAWRGQKGVTLVEACVALAVLAIVLAAAVPSMRQWLDRQALRGQADTLRTDLQWLRAAAISRGQVLHVAFGRQGPGCYVLYAGPEGGCRCDGTPESTPSAACSGDAEALKLVQLDARGAVRLQANVAGFHVDPATGTATPTARLSLLGPGELEIRHVVNVMGRVRSCSPGAAMPGLQDCSAP